MSRHNTYLHTKTTKPRLVVLVAIYKASRFIEAKMASLLSQTAIDDCLVVLLNCQNLENEKRIYDNSIKSNFIEVYFDNYVKLYESWNIGINMTDSDFIINSNTDDMLHPECFEKLIAALDNNPDIGIAHADSWVTDIPNQSWPNWKYQGEIITQYPLGTCGPCPIWRRSLHLEYGQFGDYHVIGDADFWERLHASNVNFLRVPEKLSLYYHASGHNLELRHDDVGRKLMDVDLEQRAFKRN